MVGQKLILPKKRLAYWSAKSVSLDDLQDHLNQLEEDELKIYSVSEPYSTGLGMQVLVLADKVVEKEQNA